MEAMNEQSILSRTQVIENSKKMLKDELNRINKKLEKQLEELHETEKAAWFSQIGDSLLADSTILTKGHKSLKINNIHLQIVQEVPINPKLDAKQNAAIFYKKAKKAKRGFEINQKKVELTNNKINELKSLLEKLTSHTELSDENIFAIHNEICSLLSIKNDSPHRNSEKDTKEKVPFRHYQIDTWDIYVGKNDEQNDYLSIHYAKPSDIWFHVAGHAGSHIIIRRPKHITEWPPKSVLEQVASLAVWFSKAKHTSYAEVHVTEARFVRKRHKAPPGEVIAERCKSIRVSPKSPQEMFKTDFLGDE